MPQELRVGHRSGLVSIVGLVLMLLGLAGLLLTVWRMAPLPTFTAATAVLWSLLALVTGHALWRRLEWGRRAAAWLLVSLLPVLVLGVWLTDAEVPLLALVPVSGALALLLSWALKRLNSRGVRQEFA